ncbi:MAG TPA: hypothetical protein P5513_04660 [Candidatus Diapherotrites archaeon]|nr:hypothetical protein [Candidatus Diapherotrites archaeon]
MNQRSVLILERSSQNLRKVDDKEKVVLEGVFAEFGIENRNGRIYEEREYLPHLEYLKKDMANGSLLGELDHPERFEISLGNVSHRITELWYDQTARQVKGRIEILDTPKGQIAKSLLSAGVPLSISSRAAGTVREDKTVHIDQIYTYDLVAKPGFESAQLQQVNERMNLGDFISKLNESENFRRDRNISSELGIINENISILDVSDKYPSIKLREEALAIQKKEFVKNKSDNKMKEELNETAIQQWTVFFKKELSKLNERLDAISAEIGSSQSNELKLIKKYVEKLRKIQEDHLKWSSEIAKSVNEVASYADTLAEKSNKHYRMTRKIMETVDENAKILNYTQDWVGHNAKVTNAIAETVDHNAEMLNAINEWNTEIAKGVNALNEWNTEIAKGVNDLHEWGEEKAKAINQIHEWTSSIAKGLNQTANWSEDMFGRAMSKEDAKKLIEYVELVSESKKDPALRKKLEEALSKHGITGKPLNESMITGISGIKGLGVITNVNSIKDTVFNTDFPAPEVEIDENGVILAKNKKSSFSKSNRPKELKTLDGDNKYSNEKITGNKVKGIMVLDTTKSTSKPSVKITGDGPTPSQVKGQNLKLMSGIKEELDRTKLLKLRTEKLNQKLNKIIEIAEQERRVDESIKAEFPFTALLSESDRKAFADLSLSDKKKIAEEISKNPTTDVGVIKALWENVLATKANKEAEKEPLWLKAAPKEYREIYENCSEVQKAAIRARAEFYNLNTQYQIENFWQTSGLSPKRERPTLNEVFLAKNPKEAEKKINSYVASIGEMMKKYQRQ